MYKYIVALILVFTSAILLFSEDKFPDERILEKIDSHQPKKASPGKIGERFSADREEEIVTNEDPKQKDEMVVSIQADLKEFYMNANRIQSGIERAKVFGEWMNQPEKIAWFEGVLSAPKNYKNDLSKTELAMARVYGIKFMQYLAEHGRPELLVSTLDKIVQDLDEEDQQHIKGREKDLADLAAVYIRTYSAEDLQSPYTLAQIMRDLRLHKIGKTALKELLDDELYVALYPLVGKKEASRLLDTVYSHI